MSVGADIFIKKNQAQLIDEIVQFGQVKELEFYQVMDSREYLKTFNSQKRELFSLFLRLDNSFSIFERK